MKRLSLFTTVLLFVLLLAGPSIVYSAIFTDTYDDPVFTNNNWIDLTEVPQTWSFLSINGLDLGYHSSTASTEDPAAKGADSGRAYYNANLYIETFLRIDSHANKLSVENQAEVVFSLYDTGSGYNGYWTGIELDYDGPVSIALQLGLIEGSILDETPVSIDFDTFYKLVVQVDQDQTMNVSLYELDSTFLGSVSSLKVLPANGGAIAIGGRYETTYDDFYLAGNPVPIPGAVWLLGSGLVGLAGARRKFKS